MEASIQNKREKIIPYGRQSITEADIAAVVDVLRSDYLTTGPALERYERSFADYVGSPYAVAVNSGTSALHCAMVAAGVTSGTDVITTPMSFAGTANSILHAGGTPVFTDIDPCTMNLTAEGIRNTITQEYTPRGDWRVHRTSGSILRAIAVVHFAGLPCRMDEIIALAADFRLAVVEDCAHALGAEYAPPLAGLAGSLPNSLACFSTHPVKQITTGEGGMVTCSDPQLYRRMVDFRNHGITTSARERHLQDEPWFYEMKELGYNYRLSDIHAALGASQLARTEQLLARRIAIAEQYLMALRGRPELILPESSSGGGRHSWHIFVIRLRPESAPIGRGEFVRRLHDAGIGANVHYIPIHMHPYYRERFGDGAGLFPVAEQTYQQSVTLPLHPSMSDADVERVIDAVITNVSATPNH